LEKEKKISIQQGENTERYMLAKEKQSFALLVERERKKSEITSSRSGLEVNGLNYNNEKTLKNEQASSGGQKELKLPKVQNRYNNGISLGHKNK
jgi:hypothetical protein